MNSKKGVFMLHIGVTGGIGSGKTIFLKVWEEHNVPVVYADDLAKELMVADDALRMEIASQFGAEAYHPDRSLNTSYLAREAFSQGRIDELNKLVHPVVFRELEIRRKKAEYDGALLFAHESALLLSAGSSKMCDIVILLASSAEDRIRRVTGRDKVSSEEVQNRMTRQPDFDKLAARADLVVRNDGTVDDLKRKSEQLLREIEEIAQNTG